MIARFLPNFYLRFVKSESCDREPTVTSDFVTVILSLSEGLGKMALGW